MTLQETINEATSSIDLHLHAKITPDECSIAAKAALIEAFRYAAEWHSEHDTGDEYDEYCHAHGVSAKHFLSLIEQLKSEVQP